MTNNTDKANEKSVGNAASRLLRNKLFSYFIAATFVFAAFVWDLPLTAGAQDSSRRVTYKTVKIDGLDIFYREAGSRKNPTVLLLHNFPTSSQMFRNLMPQFASCYHVVAPDYPLLRKSPFYF